MATPTTYASERSFYGIAKEVTQGTAVAMTATLPLDKFEYKDVPTFVDDGAMRGSMAEVYDTVQANLHSEGSLGGPVFGDTIGFAILGILGDVTTTGASAPFSHAGALLNSGTAQPTSYSLTDYQGITASTSARVYPGQVWESVTFKFAADGLFTFEAKSKGFPSAPAGVAPTAAPSAVVTVPSWKMKVGLAGVASGGTLMASITEGEIAVSRKVSVIPNVDGTQAPYIVRAGRLAVSGKFKVIAADEAHLLSMLANTRQQMQFVLDNGLTLANAEIITFDLQKVSFRDAVIDRGGDAIAYNVTWKAEANSTNVGASGGLSPIKVTIGCPATTGTFV